MDEYSDLADDQLEQLVRERAEALEADLSISRGEDGDWIATVTRNDGTTLVTAETASLNGSLIGLLDELGS